MDVSRHLSLKPGPRFVFDELPKRRSRARFMIPTADGDWRAITWGAYARAGRDVAMFLDAEGLKPGDHAAIFAPNRFEWAAACLGIQTAGGVMVPVYPASTADQAAYVISHSDARFVFVDTQPLLERLFESWKSYAAVERIICLDDAIDVALAVRNVEQRTGRAPELDQIEEKLVVWSRAISAGAARTAANPPALDRMLYSLTLDQTAVMLYTSGTTGNPKGVPLTYENLGTNARDWLTTLAPVLEEEAIDLLWLPMSHIFGCGEIGMGNILGFTSYLVRPDEVMNMLPEVRPRVFFSVPSYWEKIARVALTAPTKEAQIERLKEVTGGNLHFCLSGGAGLKREIKELFRDAGILIIEGYGLTETSPTLTMNRPDAYRFDSVGVPFPSLQLHLAEDGEILAKGPNVFRGYYKDDLATKVAFTEDGWFKTGDVGRFTEDGYLQIVDRKKDILVTAGGKNVPPANIELLFRDDPLIAHLVVYGDSKCYLVAGVWPNHENVAAALKARGATADDAGRVLRALIQERIDAANQRLASFETIKRFVIIERPLTVEGGMLTPTMKLKRKKIYEAFKTELEGLYA